MKINAKARLICAAFNAKEFLKELKTAAKYPEPEYHSATDSVVEAISRYAEQYFTDISSQSMAKKLVEVIKACGFDNNEIAAILPDASYGEYISFVGRKYIYSKDTTCEAIMRAIIHNNSYVVKALYNEYKSLA